jgi:hypothetical protein
MGYNEQKSHYRTPWQWVHGEDLNVWELRSFSSVPSVLGTQRLILKPLAGYPLDFKLSCSDLAESGSTFNGLLDVVIYLVFEVPG